MAGLEKSRKAPSKFPHVTVWGLLDDLLTGTHEILRRAIVYLEKR
jgi:hypothetical protein